MKTYRLDDGEWAAIGSLVGVASVPNWWYERTMLRDGSGARKIRVSLEDIVRASRYFVESVIGSGIAAGSLDGEKIARCYEVFARSGCVSDMVRRAIVRHIR